MAFQRYIICFEFDGLNFYGSQKQPDKRTVQGELEKALCTLTKNKINITPSGRTDAKVSAKYQVAHFDSSKVANLDKFLYSLNCILPDDIKVFDIKEVDNSFHAQKSAKFKHYRYTILNNHVASVFNPHYLFYPYCKLNLDRMNETLKYIIGHKDFSSFKSRSDNPYNDCVIYFAKAKIARVGRCDFIFIDIIGNRFLYNMVRTIVGELLLIERNNYPAKLMDEIIQLKDRSKAANVVEAKGLCLEYVGYDDVCEYIEKLIQKEGT